MNSKQSYIQSANQTVGFTLVEMMVVIAIFFIITGIVLVNVPNFREKTSVDLVAQDIAVTIRSAQVFGVGTKALLEGEAVPYGVFVSAATGENNRFILFADHMSEGVVGNWQFDDDGSCGTDVSECQSEYVLNGFTIVSIGVYRADGYESVQRANILFARPRPNPIICIPDGACPAPDIDKLEIIIRSNRENKEKMVSIYANGQIAVEDVTSST